MQGNQQQNGQKQVVYRSSSHPNATQGNGQKRQYTKEEQEIAIRRKEARRKQQLRRKRQHIIILMGLVIVVVLVLIITVFFTSKGKDGDENKAGKTEDPSTVSSQDVDSNGDDSVDTDEAGNNNGEEQEPGTEGVDDNDNSADGIKADAKSLFGSSPYYEETMPVLFNYANPIPENYYDSLDLVSVGIRPSTGEDQKMERNAAQAFKDMQSAASAEGLNLSPYSGYRTHERQKSNYNASVQNYKDQGYSEEEAISKTNDYYAIPGTSEHEAGLAMDINGTENSFENTSEFKWLQENASDYGFILRYKQEDKDVTKVNYEPWHYRYVGINHAKMINALNNCPLEEYAVMNPEDIQWDMLANNV